jgi:recombinational DNA repair protein RecR
MSGKCALTKIVCPETSDPREKVYCPLWGEGDDVFILENTATGEQKIERCGARVMIKGMIEVIKASNRPAAAVESTRNVISQGFEQVGDQISRIAPKLLQQLHTESIEHESNH